MLKSAGVSFVLSYFLAAFFSVPISVLAMIIMITGLDNLYGPMHSGVEAL